MWQASDDPEESVVRILYLVGDDDWMASADLRRLLVDDPTSGLKARDEEGREQELDVRLGGVIDALASGHLVERGIGMIRLLPEGTEYASSRFAR